MVCGDNFFKSTVAKKDEKTGLLEEQNTINFNVSPSNYSRSFWSWSDDDRYSPNWHPLIELPSKLKALGLSLCVWL